MRLILVMLLLSACGGGESGEIGGPGTVVAEVGGEQTDGFTEVYLDQCTQGAVPDLVICFHDQGESHEFGLSLTFLIDWRTVAEGTILIQGSDFTVEDISYSYDGVDGLGAAPGSIGGTLTIEIGPEEGASGAEIDGTVTATDAVVGDFAIVFEQVPAELP